MQIEFTEEDRLRAQRGQPVDVVDPQTNEAYVLIARQHFHEARVTPSPAIEEPELQIPEGIRISQEAYRRELPELLKQKYHQWVAYHRNERVGIAYTGKELLEECLKRGLDDDEFFIGWIDPCGFELEEEIEPRLHHYEGYDDEDS